MEDDECIDIDECKDGSHECPASSSCHNLVKKFECKADEGMKCVGEDCADPKTCEGNNCSFEDIDECETKTHDCPYVQDDNNVMCVNTVGGFECKQKIVTDDNCEYAENGRIKVDYRNGYKYRGTTGKTTGERLGEPLECKTGSTCTIGSSTYAPYCYTVSDDWDYCACNG